MNKSQNTKDEQQNDLCITSEQLTELWEKSELPSGWYWCECYNEEIKILYYDGDCFELDDPETKNYYFFLIKDVAKIAILEKVPSFEEWQASKNYIDYLKQCISVYESKEKQHTDDAVAYNELAEGNTKLKELLKECRDEIKFMYDTYGQSFPKPFDDSLLTKINQVLGED